MSDEKSFEDRQRKQVLIATAAILNSTGHLTTEDIKQVSIRPGQPGFERTMFIFGGQAVAPGRIAQETRGMLEAIKRARAARASVARNESPVLKQSRPTQAGIFEKSLTLLQAGELSLPLVSRVFDSLSKSGRIESSRVINEIFSVGGYNGIRVLNAVLTQAQRSPQRALQIQTALRRAPMTKFSIHEPIHEATAAHKWTLQEVLDASLELAKERRRLEPFEDTEVDEIAKTSHRLPLSSEIRRLSAPNGFRGYQRLMRPMLEELREIRRNEPEEDFPETYADELIRQNQIATGQITVMHKPVNTAPIRGRDNPFTANEIVQISAEIASERGLQRSLRWTEVQEVSTTTRELPTPQTINRKFEGGWKEYEARVIAALGITVKAVSEPVIDPKPVKLKPESVIEAPVKREPVEVQPVAEDQSMKTLPKPRATATRSTVLASAMEIVITRKSVLPLTEKECEALAAIGSLPPVAEISRLFARRHKQGFLFFQRDLAVMMNNRDLPGSAKRTAFLQAAYPHALPESEAKIAARKLEQEKIIKETMVVVNRLGLAKSPSSVDVQSKRLGEGMPGYLRIREAFEPLGFPEFRRQIDKRIAEQHLQDKRFAEPISLSLKPLGRDSLAS